MSIDFTTDPGGLFPRIGKILKVAYTLTPAQAAIPAEFTAIFNQFLTTLEPVGSTVEIQANQLTRVSSGVMGFAQTAAQQTIIGMVLADQPSQAGNIGVAMNEVIRQMILQAKTVEASVITVTPTVLTGSVGTGVLLTSTKRGDGLVNENAVAEALRLVCTSDSYTGGQTVGREQFGLTGSPTLAGVWDYDYPTGSAASLVVRAVSAGENANTTGNMLTNSDFEAWSGTSPGATATLDNWTLGGASVWGTDIRQNATDPQSETYCLQFLPDTAVTSQIYQEFNNATAGTPSLPKGLYSYGVNLWLRKLSGTVTAGVLTVELVDDTGTVTADVQGVNNSFTVTLSTLTTSYVAYNATFRLNATPPSTVRLRFRMSTALTGASVLMDNACYTPMTGFYQGGPGFALFSNAAVPFVAADGWNFAVTNDQGGASNLGTFQTGFNRLLSMISMNLLLPSASPGNIANTLITA